MRERLVSDVDEPGRWLHFVWLGVPGPLRRLAGGRYNVLVGPMRLGWLSTPWVRRW